nr:PREDICTED: uncharacterized protein LOC109037185 [Bemisia tabaci]
MAQFSLGVLLVFLVHSALAEPDAGTPSTGNLGTPPNAGTPPMAGAPVMSNPNNSSMPKPPNFEANAGMLRSATDFLYSYLPGRQNTEKLELLILAISDLRAEIKSLKMELGDLTMRLMPKTPTTSDSLLPTFLPIFNRAA